MKKAFLLATAILLSQLLAFADADVGKPAPDFTGQEINGKTHKLADYKGKIVVLEAQNPDCPFCANHYKTGAMQEHEHPPQELTRGDPIATISPATTFNGCISRTVPDLTRRSAPSAHSGR